MEKPVMGLRSSSERKDRHRGMINERMVGRWDRRDGREGGYRG